MRAWPAVHTTAAGGWRLAARGSGSRSRLATARAAPDSVRPPARPGRDRGAGVRDDEALQFAARAATAAGHIVELVHAPDDTGDLFVAADAAICSAGNTRGELAYLGCPALGLAIVPDQVPGARAQLSGGLIAGGRVLANTDDDALRAELLGFLTDDCLRHDLRQRALATADSGGARRIAAEALG